MDATTFSEFPIVLGTGRGPAVVGATLDELRAGLGEPSVVESQGDMSYPAWHALGLKVWLEAGRAIAVELFHDKRVREFARVAGRTEQGVEFGATEAAIVAVHGNPLQISRGSYRGTQFAHMQYDGGRFRLYGDELVEITVEKSKMIGRDAELEGAIAADPDDDAGYLVYADWLQQQGDPLGALIVAHHHRGDELVGDREADLLGALVDHTDVLFDREWKNGFLKRVKLAATTDGPSSRGELEGSRVERVLAILLDGPGRFVQDLTIGAVDFGIDDYTDHMAAIGRRRLLALRKLHVGTYFKRSRTLSCLDGADELYGGIPNVRDLTLRIARMSLGAIVLPELRRFSAATDGLGKVGIESIRNAHWPKLEHLQLELGSSRPDDAITLDGLQPILDGECLPPTLIHLGLADYESNELVARLACSKILRRIRSLDLSQGSLGPEGVEQLLSNQAAFAHLEWIGISRNALGSAVVARVREALPSADASVRS